MGRTRKSIQCGKLDQKSVFFIWFSIDNGQKTYEKIRKNLIKMRPVYGCWVLAGGSWVVEVGEKKWSLEAENGLREFFVG